MKKHLKLIGINFLVSVCTFALFTVSLAWAAGTIILNPNGQRVVVYNGAELLATGALTVQGASSLVGDATLTGDITAVDVTATGEVGGATLAISTTSTLTGDASFTGDILHTADGTKDIGKQANPFKTLWMGDGTIDAQIGFQDTEFEVGTETDDTVNIVVDGGQQVEVTTTYMGPTSDGNQILGTDTKGWGRLTMYGQTNATRGTCDGTADGQIIWNTDDGQLNICDGSNWTLPDGTTT